mmetsp:Transcript_11809/g.31281  ORF Transcript_11809/g.31281 Transcript_11809/m.31281 type:complete len:258 (+) Transcript_11809:70-843(+)
MRAVIVYVFELVPAHARTALSRACSASTSASSFSSSSCTSCCSATCVCGKLDVPAAGIAASVSSPISASTLFTASSLSSSRSASSASNADSTMSSIMPAFAISRDMSLIASVICGILTHSFMSLMISVDFPMDLTALMVASCSVSALDMESSLARFEYSFPCTFLLLTTSLASIFADLTSPLFPHALISFSTLFSSRAISRHCLSMARISDLSFDCHERTCSLGSGGFSKPTRWKKACMAVRYICITVQPPNRQTDL